MRRLFIYGFLASALLMSFGCEKENFENLTNHPEIAASFGPERPANPCGSPDYFPLINPQLQNRGTLEIVNDLKTLYLVHHLNHGYVLTGGQIFIGKETEIPIDSRGLLDYERFEHQVKLLQPENAYTEKILLDGYGNCFHIIARLEISQLDLFGNPVQDEIIWINGRSVSNGYSVSHCPDICTGN